MYGPVSIDTLHCPLIVPLNNDVDMSVFQNKMVGVLTNKCYLDNCKDGEDLYELGSLTGNDLDRVHNTISVYMY